MVTTLKDDSFTVVTLWGRLLVAEAAALQPARSRLQVSPFLRPHVRHVGKWLGFTSRKHNFQKPNLERSTYTNLGT